MNGFIKLGRVSSEEWRLGERAVGAYAKARKKFCQEQGRQPKLLTGNDNKVGIAGEYWVMRYFQEWLRRTLKDRPSSSSNPGFDFRYADGPRTIRVSVKCISKENTRGRTVRLGKAKPWGELVLVLLGYNLRPLKFGRATKRQFRKAASNGRISDNPYVSASWVGRKGWMSDERYGAVEDSPF